MGHLGARDSPAEKRCDQVAERNAVQRGEKRIDREGELPSWAEERVRSLGTECHGFVREARSGHVLRVAGGGRGGGKR
tara:strand:+ start:930 stop:1163 length:234 start_codon:yes stop_codon:yes gene_type:complete